MESKIKYSLIRQLFPLEIIEGLREIIAGKPVSIYLVGGTVRDLLLGRDVNDVDITIKSGAGGLAFALSKKCNGTFVPLGKDEDAARVVWRDMVFDFSAFRGEACTIEEDLHLRDITINSMAVDISSLFSGQEQTCQYYEVIDPLSAKVDLENKLIRASSSAAFTADPLRMLRVFRFAAVLAAVIETRTLRAIKKKHCLLKRVAAERISYELELIMGSPLAGKSFKLMAESDLLFVIFPEFLPGRGMEQPASHHLDVLSHQLEALVWADEIISEPARYFSSMSDKVVKWLAEDGNLGRVKWAALLHDVGKPSAYGMREDRGGKITFYNHDNIGVKLIKDDIGARLLWSGKQIELIAGLVKLHMRPFFLLNDYRENKLTDKACLRLLRVIDKNLPGLFIVAMADALAGKGDDSPVAIEKELVILFAHLDKLWREKIVPVQKSPPLLSGNDLIEKFALKPGPIFREILNRVEDGQIDGSVVDYDQALLVAKDIIEKKRDNA